MGKRKRSSHPFKNNDNGSASPFQSPSHHPKRNNDPKKNNNSGKKKKRKFHQPSKHYPKPRAKFWIESCTEMKPKKGALIGAMTMIITRAEIKDDFMKADSSLGRGSTTGQKDSTIPTTEHVTPTNHNDTNNNIHDNKDNNDETNDSSPSSLKISPSKTNEIQIEIPSKNTQTSTHDTSSTPLSASKQDMEIEIEMEMEMEMEIERARKKPKLENEIISETLTNNDNHNNNDGDDTLQEDLMKKIQQLQNSTTQLLTTIMADESLTTEQKEQIDQVQQEALSTPVKLPASTSNQETNRTQQNENNNENENQNESKHSSPFSSTTTTPVNETRENKVDKRLPFIRVIRAPSALKKPNYKKSPYKPTLPNGDCGDGITNPYPSSEVEDKYWAQRKRLFYKFDDGILLDKESWYSVTPEGIAHHLAKRLVHIFQSEREKKHDWNPTQTQTQTKCNNEDDHYHHPKGKIVLDAFGGCGGNSIAFAKCSKTEISLTVCVDSDKEKLKMAAHNASIYGIDPDNILFIHADAMHIMKSCYQNGRNIWKVTVPPGKDSEEDSGSDIEICKGYKIGGLKALPPHIDAIFLSPPWGGPEYGSLNGGFNIKTHIQILSILPSSNEGNADESQSSKEMINNTQDGEELLKLAATASKNKLVLFFVPKNLDGVSFGRIALQAGYRGNIECEQNVLNGKLKTITVYLGKDNSEILHSSD